MKRIVRVVGMGIIAPRAIGVRQYTQKVFSGADYDKSYKIAAIPEKEYVNSKNRRRMTWLSKITVIAGKMAIEDAGTALSSFDSGIFIGTGLGEGGNCYNFISAVFTENGRKSPAHFINSLHNTSLSYLGMELEFTGISLLFSDILQSFEVALLAAWRKIQTGQIDRALVIGADCATDDMRKLCYDIAPDRELGEGACAILLDATSGSGIKLDNIQAHVDDTLANDHYPEIDEFEKRFGLIMAKGAFEFANAVISINSGRIPYTGKISDRKKITLHSPSPSGSVITTRISADGN